MAIEITVNVERFAGLNFHVFHDFQDYYKSFSVNISISCLFTLNNEHFRPRQCESIVYLSENFDGLKP